jgi:hypothetical protein
MRSAPVCSASLTKRTKIDRSFASTSCKHSASALNFFAAVMVVQSALSSVLNSGSVAFLTNTPPFAFATAIKTKIRKCWSQWESKMVEEQLDCIKELAGTGGAGGNYGRKASIYNPDVGAGFETKTRNR